MDHTGRIWDWFGVAEGDLNRIAEWLAAEGFQVEEIPAGRRLVIFSGSAARVASAFHTEIHRYLVNGEIHRANADDPAIPEGLVGVVVGIASLNDFESRAAVVSVKPAHVEPAASEPDFTTGSSHYMAGGFRHDLRRQLALFRQHRRRRNQHRRGGAQQSKDRGPAGFPIHDGPSGESAHRDRERPRPWRALLRPG